MSRQRYGPGRLPHAQAFIFPCKWLEHRQILVKKSSVIKAHLCYVRNYHFYHSYVRSIRHKFVRKLQLQKPYLRSRAERGQGFFYCPACRTSLIATRFWVVMICPIIKCLTVLEFSFILFDLCLFITIFNFILNYVPTVTFWIFAYHKIWILLIIFCFMWNYWIIYF